MDGTIHEMLLELEYQGFSPSQAQDFVLLKHYYAEGEKQADFTDKEVNRLLFVNWLVVNGKLDV